MSAPKPERRLLFSDFRVSSLEHALDRYRSFVVAHNDLEPTLRCERGPDGRRHFVLTVHLRTDPRRTTDATPPV